jgi:hypothetical protein
VEAVMMLFAQDRARENRANPWKPRSSPSP